MQTKSKHLLVLAAAFTLGITGQSHQANAANSCSAKKSTTVKQNSKWRIYKQKEKSVVKYLFCNRKSGVKRSLHRANEDEFQFAVNALNKHYALISYSRGTGQAVHSSLLRVDLVKNKVTAEDRVVRQSNTYRTVSDAALTANGQAVVLFKYQSDESKIKAAPAAILKSYLTNGKQVTLASFGGRFGANLDGFFDIDSIKAQPTVGLKLNSHNIKNGVSWTLNGISQQGSLSGQSRCGKSADDKNLAGLATAYVGPNGYVLPGSKGTIEVCASDISTTASTVAADSGCITGSIRDPEASILQALISGDKLAYLCLVEDRQNNVTNGIFRLVTVDLKTQQTTSSTELDNGNRQCQLQIEADTAVCAAE